MTKTAAQRRNPFFRTVTAFVLVTFCTTMVVPPEYARAQMAVSTPMNLPPVGTMVLPTPAFTPPMMKGVRLYPDNPLKFDFIIDSGDADLNDKAFERESSRLIRYFLASLTTPEEDMWVNLSPYEKERIIPNEFGTTEMGRDLLAQDYILKQLSASLLYPERDLGKKFWERVYQEAWEKYGTTNIPLKTFNKVWIVPDKAVVYESGETAVILRSHLKVMLEEDYVASHAFPGNKGPAPAVGEEKVNELTSQVIRDLIIPEIEKEVNQGKNFAQLRQIYNSLILASWYKKALRESLLGKVYVDRKKVDGVDIEDKAEKEKIYQQYLEAFKKGVYNLIKEDYDPETEETIPRRYFSGGANLTISEATHGRISPVLEVFTKEQRDLPADVARDVKNFAMLASGDRGKDKLKSVTTELAETNGDAQELARSHRQNRHFRSGGAWAMAPFTAALPSAAEMAKPISGTDLIYLVGGIAGIMALIFGSIMVPGEIGDYWRKRSAKKARTASLNFTPRYDAEDDVYSFDHRALSVSPYYDRLRVRSVLGDQRQDLEISLDSQTYAIIQEYKIPFNTPYTKLLRQIHQLTRENSELKIIEYSKGFKKDLIPFFTSVSDRTIGIFRFDGSMKDVVTLHAVVAYLQDAREDGKNLLNLEFSLNVKGKALRAANRLGFYRIPFTKRPLAADGEIIVRDSSGNELGRVPVRDDAFAIAMSDPKNPHKLRQAFVRTVWGEKDRNLVKEIRTMVDRTAGDLGNNLLSLAPVRSQGPIPQVEKNFVSRLIEEGLLTEKSYPVWAQALELLTGVENGDNDAKSSIRKSYFDLLMAMLNAKLITSENVMQIYNRIFMTLAENIPYKATQTFSKPSVSIAYETLTGIVDKGFVAPKNLDDLEKFVHAISDNRKDEFDEWEQLSKSMPISIVQPEEKLNLVRAIAEQGFLSVGFSEVPGWLTRLDQLPWADLHIKVQFYSLAARLVRIGDQFGYSFDVIYKLAKLVTGSREQLWVLRILIGGPHREINIAEVFPSIKDIQDQWANDPEGAAGESEGYRTLAALINLGGDIDLEDHTEVASKRAGHLGGIALTGRTRWMETKKPPPDKAMTSDELKGLFKVLHRGNEKILGYKVARLVAQTPGLEAKDLTAALEKIDPGEHEREVYLTIGAYLEANRNLPDLQPQPDFKMGWDMFVDSLVKIKQLPSVEERYRFLRGFIVSTFQTPFNNATPAFGSDPHITVKLLRDLTDILSTKWTKLRISDHKQLFETYRILSKLSYEELPSGDKHLVQHVTDRLNRFRNFVMDYDQDPYVLDPYILTVISILGMAKTPNSVDDVFDLYEEYIETTEITPENRDEVVDFFISLAGNRTGRIDLDDVFAKDQDPGAAEQSISEDSMLREKNEIPADPSKIDPSKIYVSGWDKNIEVIKENITQITQEKFVIKYIGKLSLRQRVWHRLKRGISRLLGRKADVDPDWIKNRQELIDQLKASGIVDTEDAQELPDSDKAMTADAGQPANAFQAMTQYLRTVREKGFGQQYIDIASQAMANHPARMDVIASMTGFVKQAAVLRLPGRDRVHPKDFDADFLFDMITASKDLSEGVIKFVAELSMSIFSSGLTSEDLPRVSHIIGMVESQTRMYRDKSDTYNIISNNFKDIALSEKILELTGHHALLAFQFMKDVQDTHDQSGIQDDPKDFIELFEILRDRGAQEFEFKTLKAIANEARMRPYARHLLDWRLLKTAARGGRTALAVLQYMKDVLDDNNLSAAQKMFESVLSKAEEVQDHDTVFGALERLLLNKAVTKDNFGDVEHLILSVFNKSNLGEGYPVQDIYKILNALDQAKMVTPGNLTEVRTLLEQAWGVLDKLPEDATRGNLLGELGHILGHGIQTATEFLSSLGDTLAYWKAGNVRIATIELLSGMGMKVLQQKENLSEFNILLSALGNDGTASDANFLLTLSAITKFFKDYSNEIHIVQDLKFHTTLLRAGRHKFKDDDIRDLYDSQLRGYADLVKNKGISEDILFDLEFLELLMLYPWRNLGEFATVLHNKNPNITRVDIDILKEAMRVGMVLKEHGNVNHRGFAVNLVTIYDFDSKTLFDVTPLDRVRTVLSDTITPTDVRLALVPESLREQLREGQLDGVLAQVTQDNVTEEVYAAAVYVDLRLKVGAAAGLSFENFLRLLRGQAVEPHIEDEYGKLARFYVAHKLGQTVKELTEEQQNLIIDLSIAVHRAMIDLQGDSAVSPVSMRELIRFNVDFSKFYLQQEGLENVIELFILTAYNIYGRGLESAEQRDRFKQILSGFFKSGQFGDLFGEAQIVSETLSAGNFDSVFDNIINFADYEHLGRRLQDGEIASKVSLRAAVERARQVGSASLIVVDDDSSVFLEEVLQDMGSGEDTVMVRMSMNGFTKRQELFGMYLPQKPMASGEVDAVLEKAEAADIRRGLAAVLGLTEQEEDSYLEEWHRNPAVNSDPVLRQALAVYLKSGDSWEESMTWADGVLVKMAEAARKSPDKKFLINLDNISAIPDRVRLLLNPVLWERMVEIPERGMRLDLPENLNFVLTMHRNTEIKDESFMNRPLVHFAHEVSEADIRHYLEQSIGLKAAPVLIEMFNVLKNLEFSEPVPFVLHDLIEVAKRSKGIADEKGVDQKQVAGMEFYNYFYLRLKSRADREKLTGVFGAEPADGWPVPSVSVNATEGTVDFDGVVLPADAEMTAYAAANPGKDFTEMMRDHYGYIVTEMELRLLSQLARAQKYGNKVVQIEGPSGEGKTEIGRIFTRMTGSSLREKTINEETNLSEFRGSIRPSRSGQYVLYEPEYLDQLSGGGNVFLYNEINTNQAGGLYYWLYPEMTGRPEKTLSEFALTGDDALVKTARISRNNLWLFTVNPVSFQGREGPPPVVAGRVTQFTMAQDPEALPEVISGLFARNNLTGHSAFASKLAVLHSQFKEKKLNRQLESPQDITPRDYISVVDKLTDHLSEEADADAAFRRAVEEVYLFMWKDPNDRQRAKTIIDGVLGDGQSITAQTALKNALQALAQGGRPVMVFHNGANELDSLDEQIRAVDPGAKVRHIPLSYFHRKRQFVGGLMPRDKAMMSGDPLDKFANVRAEFEERLGILSVLIRDARFSKESVYAVLDNYTHLNPQIAPLLNEFLQTGRVEGIEDMVSADIADDLVSEIQSKGAELIGSLINKYRDETGNDIPDAVGRWSDGDKILFARWFYGQMPENLKIVATGSSIEETKLSPAELNRFQSVNISEPITSAWVEEYVLNNIAGRYPALEAQAELIAQLAVQAFELYQRQLGAAEYDHNRFSRFDIDVFLQELADQNIQDDEGIRRVAFYAMAMGLRPGYRSNFAHKEDLSDPAGRIRYEQRSDGVYLIVDGIEVRTAHSQIPERKFLAPTKNLVRQLASMLLGVKYRRPTISEGFPGGGKTSSVADLAARLGIPSYQEMMFEDIDLGEFLGRLSKEGRDFILTTMKKDAAGRFVLKFLKAYQDGGMYLLDEGAMGFNSQEVISLMTLLAMEDSIDLGIFHPGLAGTVIERHPDFHLVISQNPAKSTQAREPIPYGVDTAGQKIWVNNILDREDAVTIISDYLDDPSEISEEKKQQIADIHIQFTRRHPNKEELSPRQLILVAQRINTAIREGTDPDKAIFEGMMMSYLTGVTSTQFDLLWNMISSTTRGRLNQYRRQWSEPVSVEQRATEIAFNGIVLPKSAGEGNVSEDDVDIIESPRQQNMTLRAIALGVAMNRPVALLEEKGADAYDLVKKFAALTGYDMETLWSHPQMTRMHLLSSLLPQFEAMDKYGVKREKISDEFKMALGFLTRHLLTDEKFVRLGPEGRAQMPQKILFFHLMDSIPERQRVLLNEVLTTRRLDLINERGETVSYVLPDWVHIVVSASSEHKFSSAFINRFTPVRVNYGAEFGELRTMVQNRFPLVSGDEIDWLDRISRRVSDLEDKEGFGLKYGFSPRDVFRLAQLVQFEKQRDINAENFNDNPFYYVLKAMHIFYGLAFEPGDYGKYVENVVLKGLFAGKNEEEAGSLFTSVLSQIEKELEQIDRIEHEIRMPVAQMASGESQTLPNGIRVQRVEGGFLIRTNGANVYRIADGDLRTWKQLGKTSGEFSIKREGDELILNLGLINTVGGVEIPRGEYNRDHSLPEGEVPTREYVTYTLEVKRMISAMVRAWQRYEDGTGRVRAPRAVLLNGATAAAKTTVARNLARVWGVPLYILNAYEDLRFSDMDVGMRMREGKLEVGIKEFLARVGKINGKRISLPGKVTSSRSILLIDEANATPQLLEFLAPLFRGERKFLREYAGEKFEVEVDSEVMILLTFNPAERYSGRGVFNQYIASFAHKLWAPNPLDYDDSILRNILKEYHKRGITKARKQAEEALGRDQSVAQRGYREVEPALARVDPDVSVPQPVVINLKDSEVVEDETREGPKTGRKPIRIEYNLAEINDSARNFRRENFASEQEMYLHFAEKILTGFLLAVANGNHDRPLRENVLSASAILDPQVREIVQRLIRMYERPQILESELRQHVLALRRIFIDKGVYLFIQLILKGGSPFVQLIPERVEETVEFGREQLEKIGENSGDYESRKKRLRAYIVKGDKAPSAKHARGYFEGELAVGFRSTSEQLVPGVPMDEVVRWTTWHELGHVMDSQRLVVRGQNIPKGIRWTELAKLVNEGDSGIWLSPNIELNAMLFPLIFSPHAKEYAVHELIKTVRTRQDADDYYFQAAVGILNGLNDYLRWHVTGLSDNFADNGPILEEMALKLEQSSSGDLQNAAAYIYKNAGSYLYKTKGGKYKRVAREGGVAGESEEELMEGVDGAPDVEVEFVDGENADVDTEPEKEGDQTRFIRETKPGGESGRGGGPGDAGGGGVIDEDLTGIRTDIEHLEEVAPNAVAKFLDIFAGDSKVAKIIDEEGDEVDLQRLKTGESDVFVRTKVLQGLATANVGLTIDVSGSTYGSLLGKFVTMSRYYSSLLYHSATRNKGLEFSLNAFASRYQRLLNFEHSRDPLRIEQALAALRKPGSLQIGGGTNYLSIAEGIRARYAGQKPKPHRVEIIFTDGSDGNSVEAGREAFAQIEKDLGIQIVLIGINTPSVGNYERFINLSGDAASPDRMIELILKLSLLKVQRGLPKGDLGPLLGLSDNGPVAASADAIAGESVSADRAMTAPQTPGGIDFNPNNLDLEIKRDGRGVPLPVNAQPIENLNINGFVPIIINVTPVSNLPLILGLSDTPSREQLSLR